MSMEPIDLTTPEGCVAWSNAMLVLDAKIADQEAKVASMRETVAGKTNSALAASLVKEEQILSALRGIGATEHARMESR